MATGDETLKAFVFKKITKYRLLFPFLKENQVVAKLKRMWQNERVSQRVPKSTQKKEARGHGDGNEKPKVADKPRKSQVGSPLHEYVPHHTQVEIPLKGHPLSEITPNIPFRAHCPAKGSTAPSLADESITECGVQSCDDSGWSCDHPGIEAGSGGEPLEGSIMDEPACGLSLQGNSTMPNFLEEAAGWKSDGAGAMYKADVGLNPVTSHSSIEDQSSIAVSSLCPEGIPPLSLHEGEQGTGSPWPPGYRAPPPLVSCDLGEEASSFSLMSCDTECKPPPPLVASHVSDHAVSQSPPVANQKVPPTRGQLQRHQHLCPVRRPRVCRDWRRDGTDAPLLGDGGVLLHGEDGLVDAMSCVPVKGWSDECNGAVSNLQDATEVGGDSSIRSCDKDSGVPSQSVVCDMFVPLLSLEGQMADESSSHRRVFRSAVQEGESNFSTMFANDSDIFL